MAWHLRPPQPNYISSEQPRYQKPFDQLTPSAFSTPSISTSPQDLPVSGQGMIPKVADSAPRKGSVRFAVPGRRDSGNGVSKVTWCLTLHEERPKAVSTRIAHVGCGSGELEKSSGWWVDIIPSKHLPSCPFPGSRWRSMTWSNNSTMVPLSCIQPFRPGSTVLSFGKSSLPLITNTTHGDLPTLALIFNPLHCEVASEMGLYLSYSAGEFPAGNGF